MEKLFGDRVHLVVLPIGQLRKCAFALWVRLHILLGNLRSLLVLALIVLVDLLHDVDLLRVQLL